jgi:hypothetical protein
MHRIACLAAAALFATTANAATNVVTTQGHEIDLALLYSATDLIEGMIATELAGDNGWHPALSDPLDKLPAFTDGAGVRATGLTGLLNDFPGAGLPTKRVQYDLLGPTDIDEIRIFSGNNGMDGRVFHTYTVEFSSNNGSDWSTPIYVQSHPSGTINNGDWRVVLSQLSDTAGPLASAVTNLRFDFYSVDNTLGEMRDPFDGLNPFTGFDDGLTAAFVSPLIWEIDVIAVPEPAGLVLLVLGALLAAARRKAR